ncbi:MAG: DUF2232 domain-containing protein [Deltaproteobacteria bacterium]|nr:DUF2232 domain-containing protein [Deltaproteobacteria bacterium]MBI3391260.1 DUF2232 domain-containing protein [Deltaproteobacteria bacterium]
MQGSSAVGAAVAITGGLYVTALVGAPVSAVLLPFVPLPGLLLGGRHGWRALGACIALSTVLAAILVGTTAALTYLLALGAPTLAATAALRNGWSVERTVLLGAAAWSAAAVILLLASFGSPADVLSGLRGQLRESFDLAMSVSTQLGMPEDAMADLLAARDPVLASVLAILPGMLVLTGAMTMLLNVVIVRSLLPWLQVSDLRFWNAPPLLIWAFIATGFGMFAPVAAVSLVARNIFLVLIGCYFCQGLAIVSFYLARFQIRRGLRIATYGLIITQQVLLAMIALLGVFDLWVNFRRLGVPESDTDDD